MTTPLEQGGYPSLISDLASLLEAGRKAAVRSVNTALTGTYWSMGKRIVEYEQKGKKRAEYGDATVRRLAGDLTQQFGKGFSVPQLKNIRLFYLTYPEKGYTLSSQLVGAEKGQTPSNQSTPRPATPWESFPLTWSHYCLLMRLEEPLRRDFYEAEAVRGDWSVRQLNQQIQSLLYDRTALSKRKLVVPATAPHVPIILKPEDEIKDPYILEFLGLKDEYSESRLEEALITHLDRFLRELGPGFAFLARQKRITLEGAHYRLDLLFFHRVLKCLVAIDLKIGEFTPADAGQMNLYVNYLKDREKLPDENDPIGIILCTGTRRTVVEYALGGLSGIFAAKYKLQLPEPELLKTAIEHEKQRLQEMKIVEE